MNTSASQDHRRNGSLPTQHRGSATPLDNMALIHEALQFIPADDREQWVQIGMAIKSECGELGFDTWDEWSQQSASYDSKSALTTWKSFKADGGISIATLYHLAKENGWHRAGGYQAPIQLSSSHQQNKTVKCITRDEARHAEARGKAEEIWAAATVVTTAGEHPYLLKKGIQPNGTRLHSRQLVIPLQSEGKLRSLQYITQEGSKKFLYGGRTRGCYHMIGDPKNSSVLCIAEGFATGATIHEATGYPVAVAFSINNIEAVANTMKKSFPELRLIVCADDDAKGKNNVGLIKAMATAQALGARLAIPDFGDDRPESVSDFNDLAAHLGLEAVKIALEGAKVPEYREEDWPVPQPLVVRMDANPYPLDALPNTIRAAVEEVQAFIQAPVSMVASSALGALSLAVQPHVDVRRAEGLQGPSSLFLLTIADSGERKSTCDGHFTSALRDYERAQAVDSESELKTYWANKEIWEAKHSGIKQKIQQLAKSQKSPEAFENDLRSLEFSRPEPPRVPRLLYADATPEALAFGLAREWPSGGIVSAEAGIIFGSHGMGKDSILRNLSQYNQLWDGNDLRIDRRTSDSFTVSGARLTIALQVQGAALREFFSRDAGLARGTGFLARFLIAWPESTQGTRFFTEPPTSRPAISTFNQRIAEILERPVPLNEKGALTPMVMNLSPDAKNSWVTFHDEIERELSSDGELHDVRDVASKSADNAARLAALFQVFSHGVGTLVELESFESARQIIAWHLSESRRFFGEIAMPRELTDAARLDRWLLDYCKRKCVNSVPVSAIQKSGPSNLRSKDALERAMMELVETGRVRAEKRGRNSLILINPVLLGEGIGHEAA